MTTLAGRRILIVEDEMLVALDLEELLKSWGAEVLGPVPSVAKALDYLAQATPDAATLDMNLNGKSSLPVASELVSRDVPFVVISGYSDAETQEHALKAARIVKKPYREDELFEALVSLLT
jgi:CheY-like chemotaxis protein